MPSIRRRLRENQFLFLAVIDFRDAGAVTVPPIRGTRCVSPEKTIGLLKNDCALADLTLLFINALVCLTGDGTFTSAARGNGSSTSVGCGR